MLLSDNFPRGILLSFEEPTDDKDKRTLYVAFVWLGKSISVGAQIDWHAQGISRWHVKNQSV